MKTLEAFRPDIIDYISEEYIPDSLNNVGNFSSIYENIKRIDKLPITNIDIKFSSNQWDFKPMITDEYQKSQSRVFNFNNTPEQYRDLVKMYLYNTVTTGNIKFSVLYGYFTELNLFLNYLVKQYIYSLEYINSHNIKSFLNMNKIVVFQI